MKVLVLGSGVIGVASAYYLARAGHEVEVVDRQDGPALETSFANAGEVSPGYSAPWAGPGVPLKAIKWMLMQHSPLVIWPLLDPAMWRWGAMHAAPTAPSARYALNKSRMVPIAEYSRDCLKALRAETGIAYDDRAQGTLQLFRTQKQLDGIGGDVEVLQQYGVPFEVLDRAGFVAVGAGAGADAAQVRRRAAPARRRDRRLLPVHQPPGRDGRRRWACASASAPRIDGIEQRRRRASPACAPTAGTLHGRPLRGGAGQLFAAAAARRWASASRCTRSRATRSRCRSPTPPCAPESTIMDETHKVAVTRLGDRIRVGGTAELAGYSTGAARAAPRHAGACGDRPVPAGRRRVARPASGAACAR